MQLRRPNAGGWKYRSTCEGTPKDLKCSACLLTVYTASLYKSIVEAFKAEENALQYTHFPVAGDTRLHRDLGESSGSHYLQKDFTGV